jgi:hypothetical protein
MAKLNIKSAIKHPGALTKKAHAAGMSPMAFAREHEHDSGKTGQQARFAITLRGPKVAGKQHSSRAKLRKAAKGTVLG